MVLTSRGEAIDFAGAHLYSRSTFDKVIMTADVILLLLGLGILTLGADVLVRGGSSLARHLGMTPLLVGLTVVAFGTSMPEMLVSVGGSLKGQDELALGNVVGSNIFNVGFILAIIALISPINIKYSVLKLGAPAVIVTALIAVVVAYSGLVSRFEGFLLLLLLFAYTFVNIRLARSEVKTEVISEFEEGIPKPTKSIWLDVALIFGGLILLMLGSHFLLGSATRIAQMLNISDAVIGLTIVAAGTSTPELATSVVAAIRKHSDIAIGNVIGSNVFNILGILGLSTIVKPLSLSNFSFGDFWVMVVFSIAILPLMWTSRKLCRWEGGLLLLGYILFVWSRWPNSA